jgi:uncharacterized membrane protein YjjP (DUF1212 family)
MAVFLAPVFVIALYNQGQWQNSQIAIFPALAILRPD